MRGLFSIMQLHDTKIAASVIGSDPERSDADPTASVLDAPSRRTAASRTCLR